VWLWARAAIALATTIAGVTAAVFVLQHSRVTPSAGATDVVIVAREWHAPLDFLLAAPNQALLSTVPDFGDRRPRVSPAQAAPEPMPENKGKLE
jgi:hypothetical protein